MKNLFLKITVFLLMSAVPGSLFGMKPKIDVIVRHAEQGLALVNYSEFNTEEYPSVVHTAKLGTLAVPVVFGCTKSNSFSEWSVFRPSEEIKEALSYRRNNAWFLVPTILPITFFNKNELEEIEYEAFILKITLEGQDNKSFHDILKEKRKVVVPQFIRNPCVSAKSSSIKKAFSEDQVEAINREELTFGDKLLAAGVIVKNNDGSYIFKTSDDNDSSEDLQPDSTKGTVSIVNDAKIVLRDGNLYIAVNMRSNSDVHNVEVESNQHEVRIGWVGETGIELILLDKMELESEHAQRNLSLCSFTTDENFVTKLNQLFAEFEEQFNMGTVSIGPGAEIVCGSKQDGLRSLYINIITSDNTSPVLRVGTINEDNKIEKNSNLEGDIFCFNGKEYKKDENFQNQLDGLFVDFSKQREEISKKLLPNFGDLSEQSDGQIDQPDEQKNGSFAWLKKHPILSFGIGAAAVATGFMYLLYSKSPQDGHGFVKYVSRIVARVPGYNFVTGMMG